MSICAGIVDFVCEVWYNEGNRLSAKSEVVELRFVMAKLKYENNSIEIINFKHSIEDEVSGNPYNCRFDIKIVSGNFTGIADGCECDYKKLKELIVQLKGLYSLKISHIEFQEIGYGDKLIFDGDRLGHINLKGMVYGHGTTHYLEFEFPTDQTAYPSFISQLEKF